MGTTSKGLTSILPPWEGVQTMPKSGVFLIAVWEGDVFRPRQCLTFHIAEARPGWERPVWGRRYRTEEGEAYEVVAWCSIPPLQGQVQDSGGEDVKR